MNPEFGEAGALAAAEQYSRAVGRLPAFLLTDVDTLWIHRGNEGFGGGNRDYRITTFLISFVLINLNKFENIVFQNIYDITSEKLKMHTPDSSTELGAKVGPRLHESLLQTPSVRGGGGKLTQPRVRCFAQLCRIVIIE